MLNKLLMLSVLTFVSIGSIQAEDLAKYGYEILSKYETVDKKGEPIYQNAHGTAIGVDLSKYSYKGNKLTGNYYLTTAAHCVSDKNSKPSEMLVKVPKVGWVFLEIVTIDLNLDIAIIKVKVELPYVCEIDTDPIEKGQIIINVGCPMNIPPKATLGKVIGPFRENFETEVEGFYHGSSGGGMFRVNNKKLIGISISGIEDKTDPLGMKKGIGIFVPIKYLKVLVD